MKYFNTIILLGVLCLQAWLVYADDEHDHGDDHSYDHNRAKHLVESGEIVPLENILDNARKYHPGKVLEVELETKQDKLVYEIEILDTQGSVWEIMFDAHSGKLLNKEKEN